MSGPRYRDVFRFFRGLVQESDDSLFDFKIVAGVGWDSGGEPVKEISFSGTISACLTHPKLVVTRGSKNWGEITQLPSRCVLEFINK